MKNRIYNKMRKEQLILKKVHTTKKNNKIDIRIKKIETQILQLKIKRNKLDDQREEIGSMNYQIRLIQETNADLIGTSERGSIVLKINDVWVQPYWNLDDESNKENMKYREVE